MASTLKVQHRPEGTSLTKAVQQARCDHQMRQSIAVWSNKATGTGCLI
jgi:hypothetical protein